MSPNPILPLLGVLFCAPPASAQVEALRPPTPKVPGAATLPVGSGFLGGTDDCNLAHVDAGTGDVSGVPFTHATVGAEGQNESLCYAFGTSNIEADVWFDWTATQTGNASFSTCGGTIADTKIAAWPGVGGCPLDGTSLACNDDGLCGLQSTVQFGCTSGTTYTLQLGTFPGGASGAGTFDVTQSGPAPCGQYETAGITDNALGLTLGGEIAWMHTFTDLVQCDGVSTAYGSAMFPGTVENGMPSQIALYANDDPSTPSAPQASANTVVTNGNTDIFNSNPLGAQVLGGAATILATAEHNAGFFPAPMDQTVSGPESWWCGVTTLGNNVDLNNLPGSVIPPDTMTNGGFPCYFLLRADNAVCTGVGPGTPLCFGDGSGTPCPCANNGSPPGYGGCDNSTTQPSGVRTKGSGAGSASSGLLGAVTVLEVENGIPGQPGLFFQGDTTLNGGLGAQFGDGLRCCGINVIRLVYLVPDGSGCAASDGSCGMVVGGTPGSIIFNPAQTSPPGPGDLRCYQYWYRDPIGGPCGSGFNFSNAYEILWAP